MIEIDEALKLTFLAFMPVLRLAISADRDNVST